MSNEVNEGRMCRRSLLQLAATIPSVEPRELLDEDKPDGYLESDNDFLRHNVGAAVWLLEHAEEIKTTLRRAERILGNGWSIL